MSTQSLKLTIRYENIKDTYVSYWWIIGELIKCKKYIKILICEITVWVMLKTSQDCSYISKRKIACVIGDIDSMFLKNRRKIPQVKRTPTGERINAPTISVRYTLNINNYEINVVDSVSIKQV